jgi:hypothetical protein
MTNKEKNRKQLEVIAEHIGDMYLMEMFWDMFDDLSEANQKHYIKRALEIKKNVLTVRDGKLDK